MTPPDRVDDRPAPPATRPGDQSPPAAATDDAVPVDAVVRADGEHGQAPVLVDWPRAGRRLGRSALALAAAAVVGWVVTSLVTGSWRGGTLGNWMGLALAGMLLVELWVVGGSALRGMLRAGEEGHRLAGDDVGILPPQLRRRR